MSGASERLNAVSSELRAPSSSMETHRFTANGREVSDRISAITSLISGGVLERAPNDPSPPKLDTAAANRWDDSPPRGP